MYKWPSWTCVTCPSRPHYLERWRRDEGFVLMTTNKLSRSKRETSEAGFDFALIILTSLFSLSFEFKHRELLCTQSIRKYNWKIEPWYSRMDSLEFSSLRVVFLWGGTHIFLSRFYENRVERHHLSLSFVRLLTRRRGMRQRHHSHLFNFGLSRVWS